MTDKTVTLYFAPHQDDELSNFGADICRTVSDGGRAVVYLCTNGAASGAKRLLRDGGKCVWHEGRHPARMDRETFIAARDAEFTESCLTLGVKPEDVRISDVRSEDGALTAEQARLIMLRALAEFPGERVSVKTFAPVSFTRQNPDHTAAGSAALALYRAGAFSHPALFLERIHMNEPGFPADRCVRIAPRNEAETQRLRNAALAYRRYEPARGRYAVGYHSVYDELADFYNAPYALLLKPE